MLHPVYHNTEEETQCSSLSEQHIGRTAAESCQPASASASGNTSVAPLLSGVDAINLFCSGNDDSGQSTRARRRWRRRWGRRLGAQQAGGGGGRQRQASDHCRRGSASRRNTDKVRRQTVDRRQQRLTGDAVYRPAGSSEFGGGQSSDSPVVHQRTLRARRHGEAGQRCRLGWRTATSSATEDRRTAVDKLRTQERADQRASPDADRRRDDQWTQPAHSAELHSTQSQRWSQGQGKSVSNHILLSLNLLISGYIVRRFSLFYLIRCTI